ncbi:MAG: major capsid protein [Bacillota bacterium]
MSEAKITNSQNLENMQGGAIEKLIANSMNIDALKTNRVLRQDEWKMLDETVIDVARSRLVVADDLRNAGLVRNLGGLGTTVDQYEKQSDMSDANLDMAGVSPGEEDDVTFSTVSVPIPIIHKDFRINIRRLQASRKMGATIDTTQAATAARKVAEKIEDLILNGVSYNIDGNSINGLTDTSNTGSISSWSGSGTDPYLDVLDMIADAEDNKYYGPFNLYIGKQNSAWSRIVYSDGSGQTKRSRILQLDQINNVKTADSLGDTDGLLVQMTPDVVDLSIGQDVTTVDWEHGSGMMVYFKVMSALAPRVKSDDDGNQGIVYYS